MSSSNNNNPTNTTSTITSFHRPNAGTHTVEGSVAGSRAVALQAQREKDQQAFEQKQLEIKNRSKNLRAGMFQASSTTSVSSGKTKVVDTTSVSGNGMVGLVSAQDFIAAQKAAESGEQQKEQEEKVVELTKEEKKARRKAKKKRQREEQKTRAALSFAGDDEEEDEDGDVADVKKSKTSTTTTTGWTKDPTVDTSFLPDKQRDEEQKLKRHELQNQWQREQEAIKAQSLEITYSYWDGSGHRRTVVVKKGDTVGEFLDKVLQDLRRDFKQLAGLTNDDLLYVKEDLILPSDISFYDLIATKARGKSGPLFHFDVHDDVRVGPVDARVEKDESHPGKVVQRQWYDRSKHIFPASRWEVYDPAKDYGSYTIGGGVVQPSKKKSK